MDRSFPIDTWKHRVPELEALARPLLQSFAFQRLQNVTFLGILSPRFRRLGDYPFSSCPGSLGDDCSRYRHSIGVALILLDLARRFKLSEKAMRYAVAWGLTHDLATWPLSHTSEPAFSRLHATTTRQLRAQMLSGSEELSPRYRVREELCALGVEPTELLQLLDHSAVVGDSELAVLKQIVDSPLTPDTLEGIWRCGLAFGVDVPAPARVQQVFSFRDGVVYVTPRDWPMVAEFWECKAEIYRRFINREDVIWWESAWSLAIQRAFAGLSLSDSLELSEDVMMRTIQEQGLPVPEEHLRFRPPQAYFVENHFDDPAVDQSLHDLGELLRKEPVGS